jgi:hypothetical protein
VPRAHLQLGLIGSAAKFGGWFPVDQATPEKPFVALFNVVGVGIGDGILRNSLFRALRVHDRNCSTATQSQRQNSQPAKPTTAYHGDLAPPPVSRPDADEATQKRRPEPALDHFGKIPRCGWAHEMLWPCTICFR